MKAKPPPQKTNEFLEALSHLLPPQRRAHLIVLDILAKDCAARDGSERILLRHRIRVACAYLNSFICSSLLLYSDGVKRALIRSTRFMDVALSIGLVMLIAGIFLGLCLLLLRIRSLAFHLALAAALFAAYVRASGLWDVLPLL